MIEKIRNILLLKTMFSRLIASFLIIILIVSSSYLYSYNTFLKIIEDEITENINDKFNNDVNIFNRYIEQIMATFLQCSHEDSFLPIVLGSTLTSYDQYRIVKEFNDSIFSKNQNEYVNCVKAVFIATEKSDDNIVIESRGTFTKNNFYNVYFKSDKYNEEFWLNEMQKGFSFKIYSEESYIDSNTINPMNMHLTPVAFRNNSNSRYLIVALMDLNEVFKATMHNTKNSIIIYDRESNLIYPKGMKISLTGAEFKPNKGFAKINEGYLLKQEIPSNRLVYYMLMSDTLLKKKIASINNNLKMIMLISILISILISFLIVSKFNNPVKQIVEIIKKSHSRFHNEREIINLQYIRENVQKIVSDNVNYVKDIDTKNSLLQEFFLHSRIKDIYMQIDDVKSQLTIAQKYMILHFKVHYKEKFFENIFEETGKATYFFKELIQAHIIKNFPGTITFQMENDQIISVLDLSHGQEVLEITINNLKEIIKKEEEFAFFTITISDIYDDISMVGKAYNKLFELNKYRKLLPQTQIIDERYFKSDNNKYYFSIQQREQFCSLIQNGSLEDCLKVFNYIMDYNLNKDVNNFNINLICLEMMNCAVNVLNNLYHDTPSDINVAFHYSILQKCSSPDEHKKVMEGFIIKAINFIKSARKESDYIIEYIINYISNNYDKDISLDIFAEKLNLTNTYISSYFKNKMGVNLVDYINHYRIKKAIKLMENSQIKVKDVSVMVGMPNINTFIRSFKKYAGGYTPKKFKSMNI